MSKINKFHITILLVVTLALSGVFGYASVNQGALDSGYHSVLYTDLITAANSSNDYNLNINATTIIFGNSSSFWSMNMNDSDSWSHLDFKHMGDTVFTARRHNDHGVTFFEASRLCLEVGTPSPKCIWRWPYAGDGLTRSSANRFSVTAPTCAGSDDVLRWDGSAFSCATISGLGGGGGGSSLVAGDGIIIDGDDDSINIDAPTCNSGEALFWDGTDFSCVSVGGDGGGVSDFLGLSDTPSDYSGSDGMVPVVDSGSNQLVFQNVGGLSGSGLENQVAFWSSSGDVTGDDALRWDGTTLVLETGGLESNDVSIDTDGRAIFPNSVKARTHWAIGSSTNTGFIGRGIIAQGQVMCVGDIEETGFNEFRCNSPRVDVPDGTTRAVRQSSATDKAVCMALGGRSVIGYTNPSSGSNNAYAFSTSSDRWVSVTAGNNDRLGTITCSI